MTYRLSAPSATTIADAERLPRWRKWACRQNFIRIVKDAATGTVSVTVDAQGQPSYVLHRPAAYDFAAIPAEPLNPDWLYHGTLHFMEPRMHKLTRSYPSARRFYDINLRKDSYTVPLVMELLHLADVVKLNDDEFVRVQQMAAPPTRRSKRSAAITRRASSGTPFASPAASMAAPF